MEDIRQLLRYEIPGLLFIIYFLMLSYPVLVEITFNCQEPSLISIIESIDIIGLSGLAVVFGLPIGVLIYNLYLSCEYRSFMENRIGIRIIIPTILQRTYLYREREWWNCRCRTIPQRYEILDTGFYQGPEEKGGMKDLLERFINYYHSGRVIGLYVPLVASFFAFFLSLCYQCHPYLPNTPENSYSTCYALVNSLFILAYYILSIKSKYSNFFPFIGMCKGSLLFLFFFTLVVCSHKLVFLFSLLIISVSWFISCNSDLLSNQIKELETNLLLRKEEIIIGAIRRRIQHEL